jgi:peptidoglycan/LPS O-acetylase OafA/YrhL
MPELNSVRGVACLMVLFFHGFANHFSSQGLSTIGKLVLAASAPGWTGVNLFFVLSGLLITGILIDSKENANYYRQFYIRRAAAYSSALLRGVAAAHCSLATALH